MEDWAKRIDKLLRDGKPILSQTGLAKACGISQPSVSQWFKENDNKPTTEMIKGDNLIASARYLGVSAEWIMTGKGTPEPGSQPVGMDPEILSASLKLVRLTFENLDTEHDPEADGLPTLLAYAYLAKRGQRVVTGENVVDFTKYLKAAMKKGQGDDGIERTGRSGEGDRGTSESRPANKAKAAAGNKR